MTVTGYYWYDSHAPASSDYLMTIQLPGVPPAPASSLDVNFSVDNLAATVDDDASCTGSVSEPTAPAGKLCMYAVNAVNAVTLAGGLTVDGTFRVTWVANAAGDMYFGFSYAYTAP